MKIIIIGCGKVGTALAEELAQDEHEITLIDTSPSRLQEIAEDVDALQIVGNGSSINTLMEADVKHADLVIAVTNSDELNLLCCLIAKKHSKCHTVARVRNPIYNKESGTDQTESGNFHDYQPGYGICYGNCTFIAFSVCN